MCSCCQQQSLAGFAYQGSIWTSLFGDIGATPYKFAVPDSEGWYDYYECPAPPNALCQFKVYVDSFVGNREWIGYSRDFDPCFNVAYLKWRYTGIAREERGI